LGVADVLCPILVGRADEVAELDEALTAAISGRGRVVCVTGEAGIGKSRLARELVALARSRGTLAAVGRAVPTGSTTPYRPLTEALLSCLRSLTLPSDPDLAPWLPALGGILPGLAPEPKVDSVESSPPFQAEALVQLLRRMADPAGLVLVLEDLHWADSDTVAILEYLADNLDGSKVLCLVTARDEDRTAAGELIRRLTSSRRASCIPLSRLEPDLVAEMVRECVSSANDELVGRVQRAADGIPFLVEEVLASPGVPASFRETVRARLADFPDVERVVMSTAAIFGRQFDWHLVATAVDQPSDVVANALERGVEHQLLVVDGGVFSFRHALTRDALTERLLPPRRQSLAAAALKALDEAHPHLEGPWRDLAAHLALQSGDGHRAAELLIVSGRSAIARGALATAIDALRRADELGDPRAAEYLVEALALAGRVDDAVVVGGSAIARMGRTSQAAEIHVRLAHAAVAAARWPLAAQHLEAARELIAAETEGDPTGIDLKARAAVLEAEVALAADRVDEARLLASEALSSGASSPEVRCNAFEVLGRTERFSDLDAAKALFEQALSTAQDHDLPLWQVRAMHELGTIDMFDHAGFDRLVEARRLAGEFGALSTAAEIDLQLVAVGHSRFELDMAKEHGLSALELAERLVLGRVRAKALIFLAENTAWRGDRAEMERYIGLAVSASPDDRMLAAFAWGSRGMRELLHGDPRVAVEHLERAVDMLADQPRAEPAAFRAVWPVLLASIGDRRAAQAVADARRVGLGAFYLNSGLLSCAEAIIAGGAGDATAARRRFGASEADFVNCMAWNDVSRSLAAESASAEGWDDPDWWLNGVADRLAGRGLQHLADRCRELSGGPRRWSGLGITSREADVLDLVVQGLANKEIAASLSVSPRTVEKHVEALLRKLGARSRTHLVAVAESRAHQPASPSR
jgi:DNA-binding CsgD family transcriptional regulator/tetratricopeptide (TPR) repeat protein